jgi:hypothetical protein
LDLLCKADEDSGLLFKDALVAVKYVGLPPYSVSLIALDIEGGLHSYLVVHVIGGM